MIEIEVGLGARSYPVRIAAGLLGEAGAHLGRFAGGGRLVVVTDTNVAAAQLPALTAGLPGVKLETIVLPPGEGTKSWAGLERLTDRLIALGWNAATASWRSAAASSAISSASRRRSSSAAAASSRCRPRCSPRSIRRSAARPRSTAPPART